MTQPLDGAFWTTRPASTGGSVDHQQVATAPALLEQHEAPAGVARELGYDLALVQRIARMVDRNEYKRRQAAPGLRVTGKAFGSGRRLPIVMQRTTVPASVGA